MQITLLETIHLSSICGLILGGIFTIIRPLKQSVMKKEVADVNTGGN